MKNGNKEDDASYFSTGWRVGTVAESELLVDISYGRIMPGITLAVYRLRGHPQKTMVSVRITYHLSSGELDIGQDSRIG